MTEARVSEVCDRNEWVVPNLSRNHHCVPMFFVTFFLPPAETWPLGLLQWLVVLFQHGPGFGRHEAVGRVLSLASHFTHACAWDEIVILMAVIKNKKTESVRETHTQKAGELWITDLLQSVKRCRSTARPTEPAALLQSVGSRSRPVNISANQKWSFYDTLLWHIPPCEIWHDDCLHMRIYLWMTFHMLTISHSMTFLQNHSVAGEIMSHDPASTSMP